MILLLGADSYVGQAFAEALRRRKGSFIPLSRSALDYMRFDFLFDYVRKVKPELVINAEEKSLWPKGVMKAAGLEVTAGGNGGQKPELLNKAEGELGRMEMLETNTLLPQTIARVCSITNTPWGHVSSGSIFCGTKVYENGNFRLEKELSGPAMRRFFSRFPERVRGFSELDDPNFTFKQPPCTFYSGTKALAEESIQYYPQNYTWRFCYPFSQRDDRHNLLSQLRDGFKTHDALNTLSQVDDCVSACLDLWERRAPYGIYNVVNPGVVSTHEVVRKIQRILKPIRRFELLVYESETVGVDGMGTYPDCILDPSKLLRTGIRLREVGEALERALEKWEPRRANVKQFA